jgi:hypothetical protein
LFPFFLPKVSPSSFVSLRPSSFARVSSFGSFASGKKQGKRKKREEKGVTSTKGGMNGVQVTGTLFRLVFYLFYYFFVLLWFRLPLAKSRDKEKKGNKTM